MEKSKLIKPNLDQIRWAECEIGVIIHLDLCTFSAPYDFRKNFGNPLSSSIFDPQDLDTDQWISAAKNLGARYAILVAKHCTGFSLWPTEAHEYSVKNSPYKNGEGDIVAEFIASCKKFGVLPGIYCSASCNQYYKIDNGKNIDKDMQKQNEYNEIVIKQLTELWSNYGELFEIWFDGGVLPVEEGGPDVVPLLHKLQKKAVVFQGPIGTRSLVRWVGNERGVAPEDCSALYHLKAMCEDGTIERDEETCEDGVVWCPAESDFPNRYAKKSYQGGWFWKEGEDDAVVPAEELFENYLTSVGRNTNMLVGMVIDTAGRFPDKDREEFRKAGDMIKRVFSNPLRCDKNTPFSISVSADETRAAGYFAVGEDISRGERIKGYTVYGYGKDGKEIFKKSGKVIGHKRIFPLPVGVAHVKLEITQTRATPKLKYIELYPTA